MEAVSSWIESYEALDEARQVNVQRWLHLNKFIAHTLKIDERAWFEDYLGGAMQRPFDYGFMADTIPGLTGLGLEGAGETFTRGIEPGGFVGSKVALRARNNMGRLSPPLQDALAGLLERGEPSAVALLPSDVATLQKIFPSAKGLAKLQRKDFRSVGLARDAATDELVMTGPPGELVRINVLEFAGVLARPLT
jgi:hypothetical protein